MDNRRLFLAALLSLAVLIVWSYLFPAKPPARKPVPAEQAQAGETTGSNPAARPGAPGAPPGTSGAPGLRAGTPLPPWAGQPVRAAAEQTFTLESETARAVFSNRGAQLRSLELKSQVGGLELVRKRGAGEAYPYGLVREDLTAHPLNQALFRAETGPDGSLIFRYRGPEGLAEKRFRFDEQGFLEAVVSVPGDESWNLAVGPGIRNPTQEEIESRYEWRQAVYKTGADVEVLNPAEELEATTLPGSGLDWIGLEDKFFLAALIPRSGVDEAVLQPVMVQTGQGGARFTPMPPEDDLTSEQKKLPREYRMILEPSGDSLSVLSYWGDKRHETLAALPHNLERTVDFGMFAFLARPLLIALHWIHDNVVDNYGWAIILLTIVIKILLLPLTHSSMKSMRKMQELNPKVQAIRTRYQGKMRTKDGKPNIEVQRKMNDEVMAVYREAGVNPVGGCIPMLLQMPILFAFYNLLNAAVELRGAPWLLWVQDLAARDPYYILPLVMGATQWYQVRMSPPTGDPMQRRMFELMPIFFTFLFLGVPSGLVLYWLTNNVLTIIQQGVYKRLEKRGA